MQPAKPRPKIVGGKKGGAHQPKFLCPDHRVTLVLDTSIGMWVCTEPGCQRSRTVEAGGAQSQIVRIKGAPRIIAQHDKDGDIHWSLYYSDANILIQLPWQMTRNALVYGVANSQQAVLSLELTGEDFIVLDAEGNIGK